MTPASNPYDGLTQQQLNALIRQLGDLDPTNEPETTKQIGREAQAALSRLTRDVEEAKEALQEARPYVENLILLGEMEPKYPNTAAMKRHRAVLARIDATLTRLSRPTELGADPAFVASQSSPSVSTKGFNRGEKGEGN